MAIAEAVPARGVCTTRRSRAGRGFGIFWMFLAIPWVFGHFHGNRWQAPAAPKPVLSTPATYEFPTGHPIAPDLSSLESFQTQAREPMSTSAREGWVQQVAGQRVEWIGYVFTPQDGSGAPALASTSDRNLPPIHLQTASKSAKVQLHGIPEGAKVRIQGVLMDDQWLHVIHATRVW